MSVDTYKILQEQPPEVLGCALPNAVAAGLAIDSKVVKSSHFVEVWAELTPEAGWLLLSDSLITLSANTEFKEGFTKQLLEAEWVTNDKSVRIKHLGEEQYLVVVMQTETDSSMHVYFEQAYLAEQGQHELVYRHWLECKDGQWVPLAQQFIGIKEA